MSKYTEAIESLGTIFKCNACDMEVANCMECDFLHETCLEALQIADRLEQAEEELKDEYNSMNDWYINKFDIFQEHTECEKIALDFTLSTMQTISYLLDSLADVRGDNNG